MDRSADNRGERGGRGPVCFGDNDVDDEFCSFFTGGLCGAGSDVDVDSVDAAAPDGIVDDDGFLFRFFFCILVCFRFGRAQSVLVLLSWPMLLSVVIVITPGSLRSSSSVSSSFWICWIISWMDFTLSFCD